jgi:hypothetical protein
MLIVVSGIQKTPILGMIRTHRFACLLSAALFGAHALSTPAQGAACTTNSYLFWSPCSNSALTYSVATDKPSYILGDTVPYSIIATNPTNSPITLEFGSPPNINYFVDHAFADHAWGGITIPVFSSQVVPANGSTSWQALHDWNGYSLNVGQHNVIGGVEGKGISSAINFSITAPPPVTQDSYLDFEHVPDGTPTHNGIFVPQSLWPSAFVRQGVHFTADAGPVNLSVNNGGNAVLGLSNSNPSGHQLNATFDMPVYTVSADVATSTGQTVTLSAFDALGQRLGSTTSAPSNGQSPIG